MFRPTDREPGNSEGIPRPSRRNPGFSAGLCKRPPGDRSSGSRACPGRRASRTPPRRRGRPRAISASPKTRKTPRHLRPDFPERRFLRSCPREQGFRVRAGRTPRQLPWPAAGLPFRVTAEILRATGFRLPAIRRSKGLPRLRHSPGGRGPRRSASLRFHP
jgi:hypothetical protein